MFKQFYQEIKKSTENSEHQFVLYGSLTCFGYLFFHFYNVYFEISSLYESLPARLIAASLAFGLAVYQSWPHWFKKFLPVYWHFVLFYNLPFFFTFMFFMNEALPAWQVNILVALIVLNILTDWKTAVIISFLGVTSGFLSANLIKPHLVLPEGITALLAGYVTILIYVVAFVYKKEKVLQDRILSLKAQAGAIAHEMRTPLASVMINGSIVSDVVCELEKLEGAFTGQQKEDFDAEIQDLKNAAQSLSRTSRESQNVVTLLLTNLQQDFTHLPSERLSMKEVLEHALETFVFKGDGRSKVHVKVEKDFTVEGTRDLLTHVFFNLLKNSLYFIQAAGKGEIFITLKGDADHNTVIFKDTGPGIKKEALPKLFTAFYSQRPHGTGIGLAFCQRVMESMKGRISVDSTFGEHTTFTLTFSKKAG